MKEKLGPFLGSQHSSTLVRSPATPFSFLTCFAPFFFSLDVPSLQLSIKRKQILLFLLIYTTSVSLIYTLFKHFHSVFLVRSFILSFSFETFSLLSTPFLSYFIFFYSFTHFEMSDLASVALSIAMAIGPVIGYVDQVCNILDNINYIININMQKAVMQMYSQF